MKIIFLWLCVLVATPLLAEGEVDNAFVIGQTRLIESKVLGEDRPYHVHLPSTYKDKTLSPIAYPVLYILDGETHFHSASGTVAYMGGTMQIPETIVVAIPNTTDRMRDLTPSNVLVDKHGKQDDSLASSGGGDNFLRFIETELIPVIEANYRTLPHRTLVGHSLGGLITLHALLTKPDLFQNYIAIDSSLWWDDELLNKNVEEFLVAKPNVKARVYQSIADHEITGKFEGVRMIMSNLRFAEHLEKSTVPGIHSKVQQFPGENHGSVPLLSLYYGLLHSFEGYTPDRQRLNAGANAITQHFKRFSKASGVTFLPPERYLHGSAWLMGSYLDEPDIALELHQLRIKTYPTSSYAHSHLADFYKSTDKPALARRHYKKALKLNAKNETAKAGLQALEH